MSKRGFISRAINSPLPEDFWSEARKRAMLSIPIFRALASKHGFKNRTIMGGRRGGSGRRRPNTTIMGGGG